MSEARWLAGVEEEPAEGGADYDGLDELFTDEPTQRSVQADTRGGYAEDALTRGHTERHIGIDLLVLGNLPVLGSVWATQYVRERVSRERRRIGLIRFTGSQASAEVISPDDDRGEMMHKGSGGAGGSSTLGAALAAGLGAGVSEWVIRVDAADEPAAACQPGLKTVTVLTSGDETARVGALRIIKELVPLLAEDARVGAGPSVRVVVMGAGDAQARDAANRLAQTMQRFVARPVEAMAMAGRIRSAKAPALLYAGKAELDVGATIRMLREPRQATASAGVRRAQPPLSMDEPFRVEQMRSESRSVPKEFFDEVTAERAAPAPSRGRGREVEPAYVEPEFQPKRPRVERAEGPVLSEHVPGLEAIDAVCPYAPGVMLARDPHDEDRLHLLARVDAVRGSADSVLGMLMTAAAWAEAHAGLLGRSAARSGGQTRRVPVCHLFTDRPKTVRRLLETSLRVHLLAEVRVGTESGWYHAELN